MENVTDGIFSPLKGFVGHADFESIVDQGSLSYELQWIIPLVLDTDNETEIKMKDVGTSTFKQK
jgi:sulfate adenylyltransferase